MEMSIKSLKVSSFLDLNMNSGLWLHVLASYLLDLLYGTTAHKGPWLPSNEGFYIIQFNYTRGRMMDSKSIHHLMNQLDSN